MIKKVNVKDIDILGTLALQLWPDNDYNELKNEFLGLIKNEEAVCFIQYLDDKPIAFAECQLRHDYVEGTNTSPVGYLEGIFVLKEYRNNGYGKNLLKECEKWAKEKGCTEFASDCELANIESLHFHEGMGFQEVNRIICFKKDI